MPLQPVTPVIVRVVGAPTKELGVADVILDALGLTGLIVLASILLGLLMGGLFIWFRARHPVDSLTEKAAGRFGLDLSPR